MNTLAEKLADAWIKKDLIDVKLENIPKNRKDSHLIQQRFHNILKKKTLGWKIGLVTKQLQDEEKLDGPMIGKIVGETVLKSPLKIQYSKVPHCILECEFAFKFLEDTKMVPGVEKKKDNFGMLSVKAGIDNNPNPTKADKIVGAKMSKKAYAKDDFKPHMMYHGKKSKMAKTYEEHMALKKKGWGHTKTAATALTKSVLKHLKSGKGIKETAKQLKVDEDLVVGVARKNVQSKTTARAIGKEQNKNIIQRVMTGSKKTEKGLRDHAKASGGKEKKVIQNMLGKKQILGNRGSFKNLPKPAPKAAPKVDMKPKTDMVAVPNKDKAIDMGKVAPSMFDRAKKYMKDNAGMIAAGLGGTGTGYAMGKQANKKK